MSPTLPEMHRFSWKEIKTEIAALNPQLFDIIEEINPSDDYRVYKISYPFGAKIVDKGKLCIPGADGTCYPLSECDRSEFIEDLNYAAIPLGLILSKSCEIFIESKQQIISLDLLGAKQLFGLFEVLAKQTSTDNKQPPWSITAGARSIFMLPKITDMNAHRRIIRTYKVQSQPPQSLTDHWQIFTKIAQHTETTRPWRCEILFFSGTWLHTQKDSPLWAKFNNYLYSQAWIESAHLRNKTILNLLWRFLLPH